MNKTCEEQICADKKKSVDIGAVGQKMLQNDRTTGQVQKFAKLG
jgi:hypothetical protein